MENRALKILMIDDNQDNLVVFKALIKDAFPGAIILSALSGQKGLEIAAAEEPDVILLDIIMSGMDGYEVCQKLKADKELCDIPVVFLTAIMSNKESRIKALECGAEAFLTKPIDESELTAQIRVMLKIRNANREKRYQSERLAILVEEKTRELRKSEAKYRQIAENISDVVWTADIAMRTTYISTSVEKVFGESPEIYIGKTFEEKFTPDSLKIIHEVFFEEFEKEKDPKSDKARTRTIEVEHYRADGSVIWVSMHVSFLRDENGKVIGFQGVSRDITVRKQAEDTIRQQNELFVSLLKLLPVGVFMVDAKEGKPLVVNDMGTRLLGSGVLPDANEQNLSMVYKACKKDTRQHYPTDEMPIVLGMKGISAHIDDMVIERPDGTEILLEVFGTPVNDKQGKPWASLVTFMDITERKKAESELVFLSYHDHLTGFYNRRYFEKALKELDIETNLPLSIIICDINGLKLINDSFGHDDGDTLLVKAAKTIHEACRADDIISRIGGDEFAVLLPKTDAQAAAQIAGTITRLASREFVENIELSLSYGHDTKTSSKQDIIETLANAENHMYRHKLYERSSMRSKTIDIIMNTLFEKSDRESLHSSRVSSICMAIAVEMIFDKGDVNKMGTAGLVHDIGKIGIDENILNKIGRLSADEREQIERHPEVGWRILSSANEFSELALFILDHHEKWDGSGYPNRLKGEEIPLEARIIAVADAYDAMTSDRSYRKAMSEEDAMKELRRCSGTQFDPVIVDAFAKCTLQSINFGGG